MNKTAPLLLFSGRGVRERSGDPATRGIEEERMARGLPPGAALRRGEEETEDDGANIG